MAVLAYCLPADLLFYDSQASIARLARPDGSTAVTVADSDVSATLTRLIDEMSRSIRSRLGSPDWLLSADAELLADLRRWCAVKVLNQLYARRGHSTEASNKFMAQARDANTEIDAVRENRNRIGDGPDPQRESWASTQDSDPIFSPAAEGGAGEQDGLMGAW